MNTEQKKLVWIKKVSPILFDIGMGVLCLYIGLRGRSWLNAMLPMESGYIVFTVLAAYYVLDWMTVHNLPCTRKKNLVYAVSTCTFSVMYLTMSIFVCDIIRLVLQQFVQDQAKLNQIMILSGFLCLAVVVCMVIAGLRHARKIVPVYYESHCKKLKEHKRIVLLTDLHIGYFIGRTHIHHVVTQVNAMKPDMVLISGDLFNGGGTEECSDLEETALELSKISAGEGVFAVTGNHDPLPTDERFQTFLHCAHIKLLQDQVCSSDGLQLVGRNTKIRPRAALKDLMKETEPGIPTVVIDHDPIGISEAQAEGADYILCGHTHKGQVFPLNLFVRFLYKKDETWGMSRWGSTTSIVSAGAGFFCMPMRVGSDSEVVCIDLKPDA